MLYSRTLLFIHSKCISLRLPTPNSASDVENRLVVSLLLVISFTSVEEGTNALPGLFFAVFSLPGTQRGLSMDLLTEHVGHVVHHSEPS